MMWYDRPGSLTFKGRNINKKLILKKKSFIQLNVINIRIIEDLLIFLLLTTKSYWRK